MISSRTWPTYASPVRKRPTSCPREMADASAVFHASMDFFEQGLTEDAPPAEPAKAMLTEPTMDDGRAAGTSASLRVDVTGNAALTFSLGGAGAEASSSSRGASGDSATGAPRAGPASQVSRARRTCATKAPPPQEASRRRRHRGDLAASPQRRLAARLQPGPWPVGGGGLRPALLPPRASLTTRGPGLGLRGGG